MSLDERVLEFFEQPPKGVQLPCEGIARARRRRLDSGVIAMYDDEHWKSKRGHVPRSPEPIDMDKPFDALRFNFNKADPRETIMTVKLCGDEHPLLTNISPLMVGHTIVPLWAAQGLPQGALRKKGVRAMFEFAALSARRDFRVCYNSLGSFASVNHLHIHGCYASALDGVQSTERFPIEECPRTWLYAVGTVSVSRVGVGRKSGALVNALVFEGPVRKLADVAGECVEALHARKVPHNVLVGALPRGMCIIVPRQAQENFDVAAAGCNAAICEVSGFLVMQSVESYEALTSESVHQYFVQGASLQRHAFDDLIADIALQLRWGTSRSLNFGLHSAPLKVFAIGGVSVGIMSLLPLCGFGSRMWLRGSCFRSWLFFGSGIVALTTLVFLKVDAATHVRR